MLGKVSDDYIFVDIEGNVVVGIIYFGIDGVLDFIGIIFDFN